MQVRKGQQGFSIIELIGVMTIITIMSAVSIFYLRTNKTLLAAEEQAFRLSDFLQEAKQKSLTQKEVMRVEINNTTRKIRLIEENLSATATDDVLVKEMDFFTGSDVVRFDTNPSNVTTVPTDTSPVPKAVFQTSVHPLSAGNSVTAIRFLRNGFVSNAGTDAIGTGAIVGGITIYVWKPTSAGASSGDVVKAITVNGGSGNIRMWNYRFASNGWFDVRGIN